MSEAEPVLHLHVQITIDSVNDLGALIGFPELRVVHYNVTREGHLLVDILVSQRQAEALRAAGHQLTIVAKLNQTEDLEREVSHANRFAARVERLRRKRKR